MGIVVTIAMLLGLLVLLPFTRSVVSNRRAIFIGRFLLLAGLWNALWFGLQHLSEFWGQAALVSGCAMTLASVLIIKNNHDPLLCSSAIVSQLSRLAKPVTPIIIVILVLSLGLYAVTLIRLNLGLAII